MLLISWRHTSPPISLHPSPHPPSPRGINLTAFRIKLSLCKTICYLRHGLRAAPPITLIKSSRWKIEANSSPGESKIHGWHDNRIDWNGFCYLKPIIQRRCTWTDWSLLWNVACEKSQKNLSTCLPELEIINRNR